jgi:hypothetical protein
MHSTRECAMADILPTSCRNISEQISVCTNIDIIEFLGMSLQWQWVTIGLQRDLGKRHSVCHFVLCAHLSRLVKIQFSSWPTLSQL